MFTLITSIHFCFNPKQIHNFRPHYHQVIFLPFGNKPPGRCIGNSKTISNRTYRNFRIKGSDSIWLIELLKHHNINPRNSAMKFGYRKPSLKKRFAARTSVKRLVRHSLGVKAPKGWGWLTKPKKAAYNKIYSKTTRGCMVTILAIVGLFFSLIISLYL